ncbi:hypothetical protein DYB32_000231 [Aphanomyces invadans]|uniref:Uncharacterized protein n=1 Tax=Aphanomyces invadans TaxID=157072 RepID=A0A3R6W4S7_9STRA|nr:hypothetical protein DYB32_000231 [Aphanomyces invadans]
MERSLVSAFLMCTMIYAAPLLCGSWEFLLTWDDSINFVENEVIRRLDWRHFRAMLCEVRIGVYEPLAHLLKAMVFAACGLNSQCVRLITLTLHAASCYVLRQVSIDLLALLLDSLEPKATSLGCTLSAFLYFIHPLNVEVVAWPSAQPYALALFFVSIALAAWTYSVVMLLPVCGLVQHGIITLTADRYVYFPTLVAIPLLGAGIAHATKLGINSCLVSFTAIFLAFALLSARQMNTWRNDETLWLHNIKQDPADWRALDHLADYYARVGRVAESPPYWERSLWHMPRTGVKAKLQQARLLMYLGRYDEGCALYESELQRHPRSTHLLNNVGVCHMRSSKYALAKQSFQDAVEFAVGLAGDVGGVDTSTPQLNLRQLEAWDGQADYHANLMW